MTQKEFEKIRDGLIDDSKKIQPDVRGLPPSLKSQQDKILNIYKELCEMDLAFTLTMKSHSASEDEAAYCLFKGGEINTKDDLFKHKKLLRDLGWSNFSFSDSCGDIDTFLSWRGEILRRKIEQISSDLEEFKSKSNERWLNRNNEARFKQASSEDQTSPYAKCRHCGSDKGAWFSRVEPMGYFCEECGGAWTEKDGAE